MDSTLILNLIFWPWIIYSCCSEKKQKMIEDMLKPLLKLIYPILRVLFFLAAVFVGYIFAQEIGAMGIIICLLILILLK